MPFSARVAGELHFCAAPNFTGSDYYLKGFFKSSDRELQMLSF